MESNSGLTGHPVRNGCKMISEKWDQKLSEESDKLPDEKSGKLVLVEVVESTRGYFIALIRRWPNGFSSTKHLREDPIGIS